ncbi:hypothetical protein DFJ74DRAFT_772886 [Hyaloraphidium curvatum]|nr:hypothetical protein DFJ74DRAFT_772886 [Hyaloraphidium curvatum]
MPPSCPPPLPPLRPLLLVAIAGSVLVLFTHSAGGGDAADGVAWASAPCRVSGDAALPPLPPTPFFAGAADPPFLRVAATPADAREACPLPAVDPRRARGPRVPAPLDFDPRGSPAIRTARDLYALLDGNASSGICAVRLADGYASDALRDATQFLPARADLSDACPTPADPACLRAARRRAANAAREAWATCRPQLEPAVDRAWGPVEGRGPFLEHHAQLLLSFKDAIVTTEGNVVARGAAFWPVVGLCDYNPDPRNASPRGLPEHPRVFVASSLWSFNPWHALAEALPRLLPHLGALVADPDIAVHVHRGLLQRLLPLLGIPASRLVTGAILARRAWVPEPASGCGSLSPSQAALLAGTLRPLARALLAQRTPFWRPLPAADARRDRSPVVLLHLRRRADGNRTLVPDTGMPLAERLRGCFPRARIRVVDDSHLPPLPDLLALVHSAAVVVGVHGAFLSHAAAMRPGAALLEIQPAGWDGEARRRVFAHLAAKTGLRYLRITCAVDGSGMDVRGACGEGVLGGVGEALGTEPACGA